MPKEKFYLSGQVEDDGRAPDIVVAWGDGAAYINGRPIATSADTSGISRLIQTPRRARTHLHLTHATGKAPST